MSDQLNIWIQLVDPQGNSYKGCTVDEYTIESNSNISKLRKAVKAEIHPALSHVVPSQLKVYKNQEDLRADKHLEEDEFLGDIVPQNMRKKDALLVRVPGDSEQLMKRPKMGYDKPEELMPFDTSSLLPPNEIDVTPFLDAKEPPFIAPENWLENVTKTICENMMREDDGQRVPPMAFVRCSRGGKTRALKEVGVQLKKLIPEAAIIYVSMNDRSSIKPWEQEDPTAALCRRIAFAAQKNLNIRKFKSMKNVAVTVRQIEAWLGDTPCVLLVDELNLIKDLDVSSGSSAKATELAQFIKENFLISKGRYFVFSSHVVYTLPLLSNFMESTSNRNVLAPEMPIIPSVNIASNIFDAPHLNARDVLLYGRIPALLSEALQHNVPSEKRDKAIDESLHEIESNGIRNLMSSFITGNYRVIPSPLLQLMDTLREGPDLHVRWIPYHMLGLFDRLLYSQIDDLTKRNIQKIIELYQSIPRAKYYSGDAWESLFVIGLLIRCMANDFETSLLPILSDYDYALSFSVSLNENLEIVNKTFGHMKTCDALIDKMKIPHQLPHISIYYPTHAQFQDYDVIVAVYRSANHRQLYGYQLKEGKGFPTAEASTLLTKSFVIRGDAGSEPQCIRGWHIASANEIDEFFGESGRNWTPMKWKELLSK